MQANIVRVASAGDVAEYAANQVAALAELALAERGRFLLVLSGGSTPSALYTLLATPHYASRIDWARIHVFWGDERMVPPDDPVSNFHRAQTTLLDHVPIPEPQIHRIHGELPPEVAAAEYEGEIRCLFAAPKAAETLPRFDLVLLGLGDDGHTASLFPHTAALCECERLVVENDVPALAAWRVTMTAPLPNAAAEILFLVTGAGKAPTLHDVLEAPNCPDDRPAQLIQPVNGRLRWIVDEAAGALL